MNEKRTDDENEYDKFDKWGGELIATAHIEDKALEQEVHRQALLAHQVLGCSGVTRSDFRVKRVCNAAGKCRDEMYFLEINTQPGMSEHSPLPKIAKVHKGMEYDDLIEYMVKNPRTFE